MSWLQTHKAKFDAETARKEAEEKQEREATEARWASVKKELQFYAQNTLGDLAGHKTKEGEKLSLEWNDTGNQISLMAGGKALLQLYFSVGEHEEYDSDGCKWGNGEYYTQRQVHYCRKHKGRGGYDRGGENRLDSLYDEDLAHYLLLFVSI